MFENVHKIHLKKRGESARNAHEICAQMCGNCV